MYQDFYKLKESPFNVTADPDFFYSSKNHTNAFSSLEFGIHQRKGIIVVTGEVGTGKTTLSRKLLRQMDENTKCALILNTKFSELQLLQLIVQDLGIDTVARDKFTLVEEIHRYLIEEANKGNNVVIIIDEAQNLKMSQLEQVRLLSNLETEKEKLLQLILIGQPELNKKLASHSLRQLRQRIAVYYELTPLDRDDLTGYIQHRLAVASEYGRQPVTFTPEAIERIFQYTGGSPRSINMLCDRALLAGFVAETNSINQTIIDDCAKEVLHCEHNIRRIEEDAKQSQITD